MKKRKLKIYNPFKFCRRKEHPSNEILAGSARRSESRLHSKFSSGGEKNKPWLFNSKVAGTANTSDSVAGIIKVVRPLTSDPD